MTVTKTLQSASLLIEVQSGTNKNGDPIYSKKTFSNVSTEAAPENIYNFAKAICGVLQADTRRYYIKDTSVILPETNA